MQHTGDVGRGQYHCKPLLPNPTNIATVFASVRVGSEVTLVPPPIVPSSLYAAVVLCRKFGGAFWFLGKVSALLNMENKRLCLKDNRLSFELARRDWSNK